MVRTQYACFSHSQEKVKQRLSKFLLLQDIQAWRRLLSAGFNDEITLLEDFSQGSSDLTLPRGDFVQNELEGTRPGLKVA
jgi:hypothetical protein